MPELQFDRASMERICRTRKIKKLLLFGSRARGDARPDSDIDLLVEYDPASGMSMFQFMDFETELTQIFDGLKVDVVSSNGLSPYFRDNILRTTKTLYEQ